jgi:hypothetical protein
MGARTSGGASGRGRDQRRAHLAVHDDGGVAAATADPDLLVSDALVGDGVFGWAVSALYFHGGLVEYRLCETAGTAITDYCAA